MRVTDDHAVLQSGAAIGAISPRSQIAVAGPDRRSFLQGLLTNDVEALIPGSGCYAAWLTPQGRMLTDMHVLESDGMILLDLPADQAAATMARLDQFLFSEDVRIESLVDVMSAVWVHGVGAASVIERVVQGPSGLAGWADYRHATAPFDAQPVSVARIDQIGVPGFAIFVARGIEPSLSAALVNAGARPVSPAVLHAARIRTGYPVFGIDMTDDTIPLEAGIEPRAISFTKGCFVGQEVVVRVLHRGGGRVARRLVGVKVSATVASGARLLSGDRDVGFLTSVAESPSVGTVALGYVHRDFTEPGTRLQANGQEAVVSALPMS